MNTSKKNQRIFAILSILIVPLFFIFIELGLRLVGFGKNLDLFVLSKGDDNYLVPNPNVAKRFFPYSDTPPRIRVDSEKFLRKKASSSYRIVVQGASTAQGFPYTSNGSMAQITSYHLKNSNLTRNIEVVNTAMTAVNSYTLLDFADEIIEIKPDMVMIYAGHNEYVGLLGVGSNRNLPFSVSFTNFYLMLKKLKTTLLIEKILNKFSPEMEQINRNKHRTLMSQIVQKRNIPFGSKKYNEGIIQYKKNMKALLDKYHKAKIPVLLSTVASNILNQAPFSGEDAIRSYNEALEKYSIGKIEEANKLFHKAKDLDEIRFRAPSEINNIIRGFAKEYSNVTLVDSEYNLKVASEDRLIGDNFMMEHLHPNTKGQFIIVEGFLKEIRDKLGLSIRTTQDDSYYKVPVTEAEIVRANYVVKTLKSDWPFVSYADEWKPLEFQPGSIVEILAMAYYYKKIGKKELYEKLFQHYEEEKEYQKAAKVAQVFAFDNPKDKSKPHFISGRMFFLAGDYQEALTQLKLSLKHFKDDIDAFKMLGQVFLKLKRMKEVQIIHKKIIELQSTDRDAN